LAGAIFTEINLITLLRKLITFDEISGGTMRAIQVCKLSFHYK
jgi:hypothetical protein